MQLLFNALAGLALLVLTVWLRGLLSNPIHQRGMRLAWRRSWLVIFRNFCISEMGVAITYTSHFTGWNTSTAPTAIQASQLMEQTAEVYFDDADTQAVVVHNWGSSPGAASWAAFLHPQVWMYCVMRTGTPSSFATGFTFGLSNTNSITINKISVGTGSGGTYNVVMRRPHSTGA